MTETGDSPARRLHAPRHSGQVLIDPPLDQVARHLAQNRALLADSDQDLHGLALRDLSRMARADLLQKAWQYTSRYRHVGPQPGASQLGASQLGGPQLGGPQLGGPPTRGQDSGPVLLSGHQPQLFHPGVWFKNFLLSELARRQGATAVNLIIDNDTCRSAALRVPGGSPSKPKLQTLMYDEPSEIMPYEERSVRDHRRFASFAARTTECLRGLVAGPLVEPLWRHALPALESTDNLGRVLARARHCLEADWGLGTLELPLGELCDGAPFRWFALHLLVHGGRLRTIYNACLVQYRRANRIRSRSHPVPALEADGDWIEAPFWIWDARRPLRRGLFARRTREGLELTDRGELRRKVTLPASGDLSLAVEQLEQWTRQGVKLRPRALLTTMFARLLLSDLFVHGIGGAKYDELTDNILRQFFGRTPPHYVVATATMWLPVPHGDEHDERVEQRLRELVQEERGLRYHPEFYLAEVPEAQPWVENKRRWIETQLPRGQRRSRHLAIEECNAAMQRYLEPRRQDYLRRRDRLADETRRQRLLTSREFAFCLFPSETLPDYLLELSRKEP